MISKILDHLYLGSLEDALDEQQLRSHKIKAIISISDKYRTIPQYKGMMIKYLAIPDRSESNIIQYFELTYGFIEAAIKHGENVLVHCHAGVNRSATIVAAYLVRKFNITAVQALNYIARKRPIICPLPSFQDQLNAYYESLQK